jgi:hypothetical protein
MSPRERMVHDIATVSLGTSYSVRRTHGFIRWLRKK